MTFLHSHLFLRRWYFLFSPFADLHSVRKHTHFTTFLVILLLLRCLLTVLVSSLFSCCAADRCYVSQLCCLQANLQVLWMELHIKPCVCHHHFYVCQLRHLGFRYSIYIAHGMAYHYKKISHHLYDTWIIMLTSSSKCLDSAATA